MGKLFKEWDRWPLRVILSKIHNKVRIEYGEGFEFVIIDGVKEDLWDGDNLAQEVHPVGLELSAWRIHKWNTRISLAIREVGNDLGKEVIIERGNVKIVIPLSVVL